MDKRCLIVATGPSLRRADLDLLKGKMHTIAVNCGVFFAPWADELFAGDDSWWVHHDPMIEWYKGQRVSFKSRKYKRWTGKGWKRNGGNSGHMALEYAVDEGYTEPFLLGFDQQRTDGKAHCHADYPKRGRDGVNLGNADGARHWAKRMGLTAKDLVAMGVKVTNLSRETALTCFDRMSVEEFLEELCL